MSLDSRDGANQDRSESLKENEAEVLYCSLFENLDDGFELLEVMRDAENKPCDVRILALNRAYEELTGERPDQLIGRKWSELAVEPCWFERVFRVAESRRTERHEGHSKLRDRSCEATYFKLAEDRVGVLLRDVTERKKAEEALKESEARYRELFNSMSESFTLIELVYDANGKSIDFRYLDMNPAQERLIGRKREETLGKRFTEVFGVIEDYWLEAFDNVVRTGEPGFVRNYNAARDRYYDAVIWRPAEGQCGILGTDVTNIKRAEKALKQSEERMKAIAETSIIEISVSTLDGVMLFVNDAYAEAFGYSKEELIGMRTPDLYVDQGDRKKLIDTLKEQGSVKNFETRVKRKDGTTFWIAASISVIDYGGQRAVLGVSTDIATRKRAEEALRESREDLNRAQEVAKTGSWRLRLPSEELLWSETEYHIFGVPVGTPMNYQKFLEIVHPDDRKYVDERWAVGMRGEPYDIEHRIVVDGEIRWVSERAVLEVEDGVLKAGFGTTQDITERKRAEEALRESEAKYRGLFENLQEMAAIYEYVYDPSGQMIDARLMEANPLWLKANRINLEDAEGMRHSQLFGREFFEETLPIFRRMKAPGEPVVVEKPFPPGGPESRLSYFPLDEHRFVVTIVDISQIKKAQRAVEEYAEELKRSNAELQQFAYVASHDLQEPLRMVTSYIGLLNKRFGDELPPQAKEYMSYAVDGSIRMKGLIDDLLQYSRIDSQSIVLEEVDMNDVARAVKEDLHVAIKESGAEIIVDPLPAILGDRTQMKQLMTNLLTNAIKFRGETRPSIEVSAVTCGNDFVFSVKDNGIGIDPKYADRLFKMFSRLHTREEYPGTGIGLAISKKIVERHGGKIWFESEPGRGTTFYFTVPSKERDET